MQTDVACLADNIRARSRSLNSGKNRRQLNGAKKKERQGDVPFQIHNYRLLNPWKIFNLFQGFVDFRLGHSVLGHFSGKEIVV